MSIEVDIEHPVAQTHTHNGLARSIIKCLQSIPHTNENQIAYFYLRTCYYACCDFNPQSTYTYHKYSSSQLVLGKQSNVSHLWIFNGTIYVLIAPLPCTEMGP